MAPVARIRPREGRLPAWATPAAAILAAACLARATASQVLTAQMNAGRTGADTTETRLTPRNVNVRQFGHLFRIPADGDVYAQPLILPHVRLADGRDHDVVYVATERNSVDAWDAADSTPRPLWHASFLRPGVTPLAKGDVRCPFIAPDVGITCTPVIDAQAGTIFLLARTKESDPGGAMRYVQRLHALDVRTGAERPSSPVEIQASVPGTGVGSSGGALRFDPLRESPRASLLLVHGLVVLCWASSCDVGPYHGWIMAYDAKTLARRGVLVTSPDAGESGVWQSDTGPAVDGTGRIFVITGNGKFDADRGGRDFGNSVLALTADDGGLRVVDSFTPFDQAQLDAEDGDLGSGGPILAGGDASGPGRLVFASKAGRLYVLDPARLGGYHTAGDTGALQSFDASDGEYGAPAYWNGHVYVQGSDVPLRDYALRAGRLDATPHAQSKATMPNPGATPVVSAHGARDGIVWLLQSKPFGGTDRPAILRAFDAADVGVELWTSEQNAVRDRAGTALRFNIPSLWNGRVYVGTRGGVDVYGPLENRVPSRP